jgi:hypothetical protein
MSCSCFSTIKALPRQLGAAALCACKKLVHLLDTAHAQLAVQHRPTATKILLNTQSLAPHYAGGAAARRKCCTVQYTVLQVRQIHARQLLPLLLTMRARILCTTSSFKHVYKVDAHSVSTCDFPAVQPPKPCAILLSCFCCCCSPCEPGSCAPPRQSACCHAGK